ncbi:acyl carrier protein [Actinomadura rudentiformis]|uniref:Acyl carrier protein n=1 Tax=Actinomadura rudentiformis TaxID=359158 RepID=A0A6H9YR38_9ACTN|nr:acyl carrier protein [Actinomadura rudentiformis]KAB2350374.1 acyl carrier protein [Actinomadura rudentiformis]
MFAELKTLLVQNLKLDERMVMPESLLEDAGIDSLALVELGLLVEQHLGITFTEEELVRTASLTVGQFSDLLAARRQKLQEVTP